MENSSESENIYANEVKTWNPSRSCDKTHPENQGACGSRTALTVGQTAAGALGFLCVVLLAAVVVLCVKHGAELQEIRRRNQNISAEKDDLQLSYDVVHAENERLVRLNRNLTADRAQFRRSYDALQRKLTQTGSCPYPWTKFMSSCYLITSALKPWEESRQECRGLGADLAIIRSREEQEFVSRLNRNVWLGLTDAEREGQWRWVDYTPLDSGFWMNNEPNNRDDEDCVESVVNYRVFSHMTWNDVTCSRAAYGLCEKKLCSCTL